MESKPIVTGPLMSPAACSDMTITMLTARPISQKNFNEKDVASQLQHFGVISKDTIDMVAVEI